MDVVSHLIMAVGALVVGPIAWLTSLKVQFGVWVVFSLAVLLVGLLKRPKLTEFQVVLLLFIYHY